MDTLRNLATRHVMGGILHGLKFFEPTRKFVGWMKRRYLGIPIYDVGAGRGHVSKALSGAGLDVLAIDINHREPCDFPVAIADGEAYPYPPGSIVMLCRPCHGMFTEQVISQAGRRGAGTVLYVGLDRNVEMDLGRYFTCFERVLIGAGQEDEKVWMLKGGSGCRKP